MDPVLADCFEGFQPKFLAAFQMRDTSVQIALDRLKIRSVLDRRRRLARLPVV